MTGGDKLGLLTLTGFYINISFLELITKNIGLPFEDHLLYNLEIIENLMSEALDRQSKKNPFCMEAWRGKCKM